MSLSVTPSGTTPIYLYTAPADMRKGFVTLTGLIESTPATPGVRIADDGLFVFINQ